MSSYEENTNIIILDACRTNINLVGQRGIIQTGLSYIYAPRGTFISYSTSPNSVAMDGTGKNSLFAESLNRHIQTTGLKIEDVFKNVRYDVQKQSKGKQIPWEHSSLIGDVYFIEPRHDFSNKNITPKMIYDYAQSIWDEYKKKYTVDRAEALVFIKVANHFNITLLEAYKGYSIIQYQKYYNFSDGELCVLGLERYKQIGFTDKNHRWYYDGNPVSMGEILPLPIDLEIMLPESGLEIDVTIDFNGSFESEKLVLKGKCNLPDNMLLMVSMKSAANKYFAQDKIQVLNGLFSTNGFSNKGRRLENGRYTVEITSPIYSVQPEDTKYLLGNHCRNLSGTNVEFNIIGGNTVRISKEFDIK